MMGAMPLLQEGSTTAYVSDNASLASTQHFEFAVCASCKTIPLIVSIRDVHEATIVLGSGCTRSIFPRSKFKQIF